MGRVIEAELSCSPPIWTAPTCKVGATYAALFRSGVMIRADVRMTAPTTRRIAVLLWGTYVESFRSQRVHISVLSHRTLRTATAWTLACVRAQAAVCLEL
jgi:hypothetical protein